MQPLGGPPRNPGLGPPPGAPGQYPGFQPPPAGSYGHGASPGVRTADEATTALILGIASWFCFPLGFVAIFIGARARRKIRENPTQLTGDSLALVGMIMGGLIGGGWMLFWLFYLLMVVGIIGAAALSAP